MRVTVVGLGYVGLVTATCLARLGQDVIGLEADESKVRTVLDGDVPYYEPGLEAELHTQRASGASTSRRRRARRSPIPRSCSSVSGRRRTQPAARTCGTCWTSPTASASELQSAPVIALRSTVPVGTTRRVERRLNESLKRRGSGEQVAVIANPEFLRTGRALEDFLQPTRIVLGTTELATGQDVARLRSLYGPLEAPTPRDGCRERRAGQERRERLPGDQDQLRQRAGEPVRRHRRVRRRGHSGSGARSADRWPTSCARASATAVRACPRTCAR